MVAFDFRSAAYFGLTPGLSDYTDSAYIGLLELAPIVTSVGGGGGGGGVAFVASLDVLKTLNAGRSKKPLTVEPLRVAIDEQDDEIALLFFYLSLYSSLDV